MPDQCSINIHTFKKPDIGATLYVTPVAPSQIYHLSVTLINLSLESMDFTVQSLVDLQNRRQGYADWDYLLAFASYAS